MGGTSSRCFARKLRRSWQCEGAAKQAAKAGDVTGDINDEQPYARLS